MNSPGKEKYYNRISRWLIGAVFSSLLLMFAFVQPLQAASAQAVEAETGTITVRFIQGQEFSLYKIADYYSDGSYELVSPFKELASSVTEVKDIADGGIWSYKSLQALANTLEGYVNSDSATYKPVITGETAEPASADRASATEAAEPS